MKKPLDGRERGSILIFIVLTVVMVMGLGYGLLTTRQAWRESAAKRLALVSEEQDMIGWRSGVRDYVADQISANSTVNLSNVPRLSSGATLVQRDGPTTTLYNYSGGVTDLPSIAAVQSATGAVQLTDSDDPLYGAKAVKSTFTYRQDATLVSGSSSLGSRAARDRRTEIVMEVRQMPLSQFSFFSSTNAVVKSPLLGRAHSNGNLVVSANTVAQTDYPLTVGGSLALESNAAVTVKQSPDAGARSVGVSSATDASTKRAMMKGLVVDQDVSKSVVTTALPIADFVTTADLGTPAKNAQKLSTNCDVTITYNGTTGIFQVQAPNPTIAAVISGTATMHTYSGRMSPSANGHPVIEFDVERLVEAGSVWGRYYVSCPTDPNAIVIIRGAGTLPWDFSLVTPHEVWVDEEFNVNPTQMRAASIITSKRVIGVWGG